LESSRIVRGLYASGERNSLEQIRQAFESASKRGRSAWPVALADPAPELRDPPRGSAIVGVASALRCWTGTPRRRHASEALSSGVRVGDKVAKMVADMQFVAARRWFT